ncbi:MAG: phosphate starvation-inducible protein PhoH, partial [Candidatus Omnitrophica bacterium CG23_combo_of_CG06-09_8_20_14_all_41_10]
MLDKIIKLKSHGEAQALCGTQDANIRLIEKEFKVKLTLRNEHLKVSGTTHNIKKASGLIDYLLNAERSEQEGIGATNISNGKQIRPKTNGQREYVEAIRDYDIVFGIGPAGTGKTYLAMASAVEALKKQEIRRIILTRPAIEAGESLGFLPGDINAKISPYLRPLYDAIYDMMDAERIEKYIETGIIEVAPLAYMRGRTLNDAFIILDEAQNCTAEQMKMFLTRLGFDS